jgi:death-on-curing protein
VKETVFLTTEHVVALARERWGAEVRDLAVVDGAVMACRQTFDGEDLHPSLWDKAVCLVGALASTQGFTDGNKRAAWTAAETFLAINAVFVDPPDVCSTVYVLGMSQRGLVEQDIAVQWLKSHRVKPR